MSTINPIRVRFKKDHVSFGNNIVQDSLVLNLDAGNFLSYPGSGTTWTDLSGQGNDGTLVNGVGYNSSNGGSLSFDGANDYVSASSISFGIENFTTSAIIKSNNTNFQYMIAQGGTGVPGNNGYGMALSSEGKVYGFIQDNSGRLITTPTPNTELSNDGLWHHICASWNRSNDVSFYVDGIFQYKESISSKSGSINGNPLFISGYGNPIQPVGLFLGNIAQVSIYNRALTAAEIQQNFNATRSRFGI